MIMKRDSAKGREKAGMRDYKQMQEIQRMREQAEKAEAEKAGKGGDAGEDAGPEREKDRYSHRKPGFKGWVSYLFEYYRWPIVIGLVILIGIGVGVSQIRDASNPDYALLYVGPPYLALNYEEQLEHTLANLSGTGEVPGDCNGDGEYKVRMRDVTVAVLTDAEGEKHVTDDGNTALGSFQTELTAGEAMLYFLEPSFYQRAKGSSVLQRIEAFGDEYAAKSFDGYGVYLGDLDAYALDGLSRMPAETVVCLRRSPEDEDLSYGRGSDDWSHHRDLFLRLLGYEDDSADLPNEGSDADVTLLVVSEAPVCRSVRRPIDEALSKWVSDGNGDGKRVGRLRPLLRSGSSAARDLQAKEIRTELVTGDSMLWLLDEEAYAYAKKRGLIAALPEELAEREGAVDGLAIKLYTLDCFGEEGFCGLHGSGYLCLRRDPAEEAESYGRTAEAYERAKEVFSELTKEKK